MEFTPNQKQRLLEILDNMWSDAHNHALYDSPCMSVYEQVQIIEEFIQECENGDIL